jgi:hypothetical protein
LQDQAYIKLGRWPPWALLTLFRMCVCAADDVVTYTITATNTGSLQLRNLVFTLPCTPQCSSPDVTLTCMYGSSNTTANTALDGTVTLELDQVVVCTGTYTFTQVCVLGMCQPHAPSDSRPTPTNHDITGPKTF